MEQSDEEQAAQNRAMIRELFEDAVRKDSQYRPYWLLHNGTNYLTANIEKEWREFIVRMSLWLYSLKTSQ